MHLRCISRNRIHRPVLSYPILSSRPPRPSAADLRRRDMSGAEGKPARKIRTEIPRSGTAWHFYARGHVFVINRARCLTLGFQRGLIFQTARSRSAGDFARSPWHREMRRNFYAPVLAVGERDEKRRTQRYLPRVINARIDVEVSPGRRVFVSISSRV